MGYGILGNKISCVWHDTQKNVNFYFSGLMRSLTFRFYTRVIQMFCNVLLRDSLRLVYHMTEVVKAVTVTHCKVWQHPWRPTPDYLKVFKPNYSWPVIRRVFFFNHFRPGVLHISLQIRKAQPRGWKKKNKWTNTDLGQL